MFFLSVITSGAFPLQQASFSQSQLLLQKTAHLPFIWEREVCLGCSGADHWGCRRREKKKAAGCGKKLEIESTWEKCNPPSRRGGQSRKLMTRPEDVNAQEHNRAWRDVSHVGAQFGLVHQFIKQTGYILKIKTCNHFGTGELNRKWQEWRILGG